MQVKFPSVMEYALYLKAHGHRLNNGAVDACTCTHVCALAF